jgi:hypothetical protein
MTTLRDSIDVYIKRVKELADFGELLKASYSAMRASHPA